MFDFFCISDTVFALWNINEIIPPERAEGVAASSHPLPPRNSPRFPLLTFASLLVPCGAELSL